MKKLQVSRNLLLQNRVNPVGYITLILVGGMILGREPLHGLELEDVAFGSVSLPVEHYELAPFLGFKKDEGQLFQAYHGILGVQFARYLDPTEFGFPSVIGSWQSLEGGMSGGFMNLSVAFDTLGHIHFLSTGGGRLLYGSNSPNGTVRASEVPGVYANGDTAIAIGPNADILIASVAQNRRELWVGMGRLTDPNFAAHTMRSRTLVTVGSREAILAVDAVISDSRMILSYCSRNSGTGRSRFELAHTTDGEIWDMEEIVAVPSNTTLTRSHEIVLPVPDGTPAILSEAESPAGMPSLVYLSQVDGEWVVEEIDSGGAFTGFEHLNLFASGGFSESPIAVYRKTNLRQSSVFVAERDADGVWKRTGLAMSNGSNGTNTGHALAATADEDSGQVFLSFNENNYNPRSRRNEQAAVIASFAAFESSDTGTFERPEVALEELLEAAILLNLPNNLIRNVENALRFVSRENPNYLGAARQLRTFSNRVFNLIVTGTLAPEEGQKLITQALEIVVVIINR